MAGDKLEFWTNPMSRGQIAHWMLEELGQPYETHWLEWGATKSPEYLAVNPMGKVPAIRHNGQVVTECAAICLYLAEAFPRAGLKPGPEGLADYYRWTLFAAGPVEQAVVAKSMKWETPAERAAMLGFGSFDATIAALEGMLKTRAFVCGDHFTAADVYVGSQVDWGLAFGSIPKLPAFEAYAERLRARPAYGRSKAINGARISAATPA